MLAVINNFMLDISRVDTATCDSQSSDGYVTLQVPTHNKHYPDQPQSRAVTGLLGESSNVSLWRPKYGTVWITGSLDQGPRVTF